MRTKGRLCDKHPAYGCSHLNNRCYAGNGAGYQGNVEAVHEGALRLELLPHDVIYHPVCWLAGQSAAHSTCFTWVTKTHRDAVHKVFNAESWDH